MRGSSRQRIACCVRLALTCTNIPVFRCQGNYSPCGKKLEQTGYGTDADHNKSVSRVHVRVMICQILDKFARMLVLIFFFFFFLQPYVSWFKLLNFYYFDMGLNSLIAFRCRNVERGTYI